MLKGREVYEREEKGKKGRREWNWRKRGLEVNQTRGAIRGGGGIGIYPRWMKLFSCKQESIESIDSLYEKGEKNVKGGQTGGRKGEEDGHH